MTNPALHFQQLRKNIRDELADICDFDAACITTIDPATLLSTGSFTDEPIESIHNQLFQNEFLKKDVHQHEDLAKGPVHTASLVQSGEYLNSGRYQHILLPNGWADELRVALVIQGECWGIASLYRKKGKEPFHEQDIQAVSRQSPALAANLRDELFKKRETEADETEEHQGFLILSHDYHLLYGNEAGLHWLHTFQTFEQIHDDAVMPRPFRALGAKLLYGGGDQTAVSISRMPTGLFLSLQAFRLTQATEQEEAVMIHIKRAQTSDILPYAAKTYRLTEREMNVLDCLIKGQSTKEIASTLFISPHTVHDHVKAMLQKTNLSSRRMLVYFFSHI
ncbi:helix-turn-helix transcriptional regulator [Bacillus xiamenensis]|uniref:Helix-turn-helix transcriptional regulator n=1 Tax=Bacillus xiamenensis TaxID=1178537 RepID=A0AAC9NAT2_9BACI|nr:MULTISPECIES: helix-turn-helix transcriptional regulator [Bacillus]AOZ88791.1 helix-turn-helix transcriptional regulator [Bacillus xiamenensis]MBG9911311.1 LuxR family transcriptional regulator [Bacillus xiamenensis]MCW1836821.1 helix-turn-helix transcriptional regulator [Bacillus xiamenensis]MCY9574280.1 helix-turn-helix transcriptional regulator [Bacillus xiamenensis]QGX64227.1 GAF domain-containing protein [Bacillus sp. ms-22]